jgi:hypothetical protein
MRIIRTKSPTWQYEDEWRYARTPMDGGPGMMDVPMGAIVEVRLGCRISRWHARRLIAAARRLPDRPRIYQARLDSEHYLMHFDALKD